MNNLISHSCSSLLEEKSKEPDINNEPKKAETFGEPAEEPIYATVDAIVEAIKRYSPEKEDFEL